MNLKRLEIAAIWLATTAAVSGGWVELVDSGGLLDASGGQIMFFTLAAVAAPALATAIQRRHPHESAGVLVGVTVLSAMLAACRTTPLGAFTSIAGITALLTPLLPAYAVIRYSALQAPPRAVRTISWCFWVSASVGALVVAIVVSTDSVPGPLWYSDRPAAADAIAQVLMVSQTGVTVVALAGFVLAYQRRSLPRNARSALRPMMWPAVAWAFSAGAASVWASVTSIRAPAQTTVGGDAITTYIVLPVVLVGVLAAGLGWIDLSVRNPAAPTLNINVKQYLSRALADPSIRVLYPVDTDVWVNSHGEHAVPDLDAADRAVTVIRRGPTLIGLIEQDAANTARPDAVELVATGAGLIMETERLTAAANRDLGQTRLLASRLLSAVDEPREVLRAKLLSGPLADLDAVAAVLSSGAALADVVPQLTAIAAEVRSISHGMFPTSLASGGLRAALAGTVVPDARYPAVVEMTAFLAARDDPCATIAEIPSGLQITTERAPNQAVRDRVTALGGEVEGVDLRWSVIVPLAGR